MTSMKQGTSEAVAEWTKVFPKQATENYTSSVMFMKQLTVVAVSTITYLKGAFPEENFMVESFCGMRIYSLKHKCKDELAQFISTALAQAFDALDKKYLYQLALCFYDGDCKLENLMEYYIFEFTYKEAGVCMSLRTKGTDQRTEVSCTMSAVRAQTTNLLRACLVSLHSLGSPLPEQCDVSLRLYYNDDTPEEYQAPGYSSAADSEDPLGGTLAQTYKLGSVDTKHHRLALRSYVRDTLPDSHEACASQNPPTMTLADDVASCVSDQSVVLRCACNNYQSADQQNIIMLTCQYCATVQHSCCYGVMTSRGGHCCVPCAEEDPTRTPTDKALLQANKKKRECIAIFRRALWWCSRVSSSSCPLLVSTLGISLASARKLRKQLHHEGILIPGMEDDIDAPEQIDQEKLKTVMAFYFQSEEQNIVERLVAETFSQGSQPDPIAESLSQEERASLQTTSQMGRIINPEVNNNEEDVTLKQYRDALIRVERMSVDSPLSGDPIKDIENFEKKTVKRKLDKDDKIVTSVKTKRSVRRK